MKKPTVFSHGNNQPELRLQHLQSTFKIHLLLLFAIKHIFLCTSTFKINNDNFLALAIKSDAVYILISSFNVTSSASFNQKWMYLETRQL